MRRIYFLILLLGTAAVPVLAQYQDISQFDRGTPPQHAAGVSSIGSYLSTDLGIINLGNGALNFRLPIGEVGGRGLWLPLTLNYSSKVWSANMGSEYITDPSPHRDRVVSAMYDDASTPSDLYNKIGPGWTIGANPFLKSRGMGMTSSHDPNTGCTNYRYVLVKLTLVLPDKGEIEFRDDQTDGSPLAAQIDNLTPGCRDQDGNRGTRWHSTDGSGMIFISDNPNGVVNGDLTGTVVTSDGTRYRFSNPQGFQYPSALINNVAECSQITDRNGNIITITYPTTVYPEVDYTDPLGRITKIQQNILDPTPNPVRNPDNSIATLAVLVDLPGINGQHHYYKILSDLMNAHYRNDISPTLPVINGDYDPLGYGYGWGTRTALFPYSYGSGAQEIDNYTVITKMILPDGRSLNFSYNAFGEVAEVQLPTGGKLQYDYANIPQMPIGNSLIFEVQALGGGNVQDVDRGIVAKRSYPDGATLQTTWTYTYSASPPSNGVTTNGSANVRAYNGSTTGPLVLNNSHWFKDGQRDLTYVVSTDDKYIDGTGYALWSTGLERRNEILDSNSAVLKATEQDWSQRAAISWTGGYTVFQAENDNRVNEVRNYLDNGSYARMTTTYDAYNNPTDVWEYDYDGSAKRETVNSYVTLSNYLADAVHLVRLPSQQTVKDGQGATFAQTVYEYDNYAQDGNHAPLQSYASVSGHDSGYGTGKSERGNQTMDSRLVAGSTFVSAYSRFDFLGNIVSIKDARSNVTQFSFSDDFGDGSNPGGGTSANPPTYALETMITSPPPNVGDAAQVARSQYDFSTGLLTGFKDRNGVVTKTIYNDPFDRPTLVTSALNASIQNNAIMYYAPSSGMTGNDTAIYRDQVSFNDGLLQAFTHTDGLGRAIQEWTFDDPEGNVEIDTNYDALGRIFQKSNPFRPSAGESEVYTTTYYDLAGRVIQISYPDGSSSYRSYQGNTVTETDQAGNQRLSTTDALGRLTQVQENPSGLNYTTSYAYDPLDDLVQVSKTGQVRTFSYDGLKRLLSAFNPESGTIQYQYDGNGNLTYRTDALLRSTTSAYDALNRIKSRTYGDGVTPNVTYYYDTAPLGIGRLASVYSSVSVTGYGSYDQMGRVLTSSQQTNGQAYSLSYQYDLAGELRQETYPSGRVVTTGYNTAGRANSLSGTLGGNQRNYVTSVNYASQGALSSLALGNGLRELRCYNSRLQPFSIRLRATTVQCGTGPDANDVVHLGLNYGTTNNNGNIQTQTITVPGKTFTQGYTYDQVNRLATATENNPSQTWSQTYSYDIYGYGNRAVTGGYIPNPTLTPQSVDNFEITNRLKETLSWHYDSSGNLLSDPAGRSFAYDSENRQTSFNGTAAYVYDGDGRRVKEVVSGSATVFVYDVFGHLVTEYGSQALSGPATAYITGDHLGSTRLVTDASGSVVARHDYLPFGEEIPSSIGGRSTVAGYGSTDSTRQRFTGKERDAETGLDYFGARYLSSAQGRFTSPDPLLNSGRPWEPQTWNRYAYARNNPLTFTDPTGLYDLNNTCDPSNNKCNKKFREYADNLKNGLKDLQNRLKDTKDPAQKLRLETALKAMGTEGDHNNVLVSFGKTQGGGAAETIPSFNEQTGKMGYGVTFDPSMMSGQNDYAVAGAHEGTHVDDLGNPLFNNPATTLSNFSLEYRGYQTSVFAASALGFSSFDGNYDGKKFELWNGSWAQVDRNITRYVTGFHDKNGKQTHPETTPHNPWGN